MSFWDWFSKDYEYGKEKFGYSKRIFAGIFLLFVVPILIYLLLTWDFINYRNGEQTMMGAYIVLVLYWIGLYFVYKRGEAKRRLNQLLNKFLYGDDKEFEHLLEILRKRRKIIKEENLVTIMDEQDEDRVKWFGIK
jgi:hypothetical protein